MIPQTLYLDFAQLKLLSRRLIHIKEKLDVEDIELIKKKNAPPTKFTETMMLET